MATVADKLYERLSEGHYLVSPPEGGCFWSEIYIGITGVKCVRDMNHVRHLRSMLAVGYTFAPLAVMTQARIEALKSLIYVAEIETSRGTYGRHELHTEIVQAALTAKALLSELGEGDSGS